MGDRLKVSATEAFAAAQAIGNHAEDLRDELQRLVREWEDLSHSWSGAAASAFAPPWQEWHEGAAKLTEMLADTSRKLAGAAVVYDEQDSEGAHALGSAADGIPL
jgi:WXG100 family type VII secretion target